MSDSNREPVIVAAARTPIGKFLGGLAALSAPELGAAAIRAALERSKVPAEQVEEVIMGNVIQGGVGQAPARQATIKSGLPETVTAVTVNQVCGSGLRAVMMAAQAIKAGDRQVVVAGGQESMSNAPFYVYGMRNGVKLGDQQMVDGMIKDGLWCAFCDVHMGGHAEYTATKAKVSRAQQDEFAAESHRKAIAAQQAGKFRNEIVPLPIARRKGPALLGTDGSPRADTTADSLSKLRPAFPGKGDSKDLSVTAGNASSLNDGGAAVIVTSREFAKAHGLTILAKITGYSTGAVKPQDLFFAPITAVNNLMKKYGKQIDDYDLIEADEGVAPPGRAGWGGLGREGGRGAAD